MNVDVKQPRNRARRALANRNAPKSLRLTTWAVIWLLMDRLDPPGWIWGCVAAACVLMVVVLAADFLTAEEVEL